MSRGPTPAGSDLSRPRTFDDLFTRGPLAAVNDDYKKVEEFLIGSCASDFELVPRVVRHLVEAGGKRIRPIVHCLAARLCGYEGEGHVVLASVSEMIHSATLFHDDVIDEGKVRRGRPTANTVWGNQIPVLVGDFVFARAFTIMMDHGYYRIARELATTVEDLVQGELLQLTHAGNPLLSRDVYTEIIRCKTASLFSWCGRSAAMIADLPPDGVDALAGFGHHFGVAFQITDDVLDYAGNSSATGKGSLSDLREGKVTLPLILAMEEDPRLATEVESLLAAEGGGDGDAGVAAVADRVRESGAVDASIGIAEKHLDRALGAMDRFSPSSFREALTELCRFISSRTH